MLELTYKNAQGETLNINQDEIRTISIEGLGPECVINTSDIPGHDGATYISSQMAKRNIVLMLDLKGDYEENRLLIYNIFRAKQYGTFYYKSDNQEKEINCITEKIYASFESGSTEIQISLLCPDPYFHSLTSNTKIMSAVRPLFHFPHHFDGAFKFSERMKSVIENFVNDSSIEVSPIIEFVAKTSLENPSIMNINTYEKAQVNIAMQTNDKIIIDTRKGYKDITLIRSGVETNIFNYKADDFRFFKLHIGDNYLKYDADINPGGLQTTVKWEDNFGGV